MAHIYRRPVEKEITKEQFLKRYNVPVSDPKPGESAIYRNPEYPSGLPDPSIWTLPGVTNLVEMFEAVATKIPDDDFLGTREKLEDGSYGPFQWQSYGQVAKKAERLAYHIRHTFGVGQHGCVGVWGKNTAEWVITEWACYLSGTLPVALYDTLGPDSVAYVIDHAECAAVFASGEHYENLMELLDSSKELQVKSMKSLILFDQTNTSKKNNDAVKLYAFNDLVAEDPKDFSRFQKNQPNSDDPCTILYTSGSTGVPKGVVITHKNFIATTMGLYSTSVGSVFWSGGTHISYLPLAHAFERLVQQGVVAGGGRIGFFTGNIANLVGDIQELKPTFMVGVPRVFQRIHDKIIQKITKAGGVKQKLFEYMYWWKNSALESQGQSNPKGENTISDTILFNKIKNVLGGNLKMIFSGAAPLDPGLGSFLRVCFGVPVIQGYGMSETCAGAICGQLFDAFGASHNGGTISCMEFKLRDVPEMGYFSTDKPQPRGELLFRGHNIMKGYHKEPEKTAATFTEDGWLCSGDIGTLGPNNEVLIIDRKKNIFKLAQGEYIAPEYLEIVYSRPAIVAQIFVHGSSLKPNLMAVVVPDEDHIRDLAIEKGYGTPETPLTDLCQSNELRADILHQLRDHAVVSKLKGIEKLHGVYLEHEPFSVENDLLTPSFKQRRQQLRDKYEPILEKMYEQLNTRI